MDLSKTKKNLEKKMNTLAPHHQVKIRRKDLKNLPKNLPRKEVDQKEM